MVVAGFAGQTDIDHATEMANEVRCMNRQLEECKTLAQTYKTRQRLLGVPVRNVSDRQCKL